MLALSADHAALCAGWMETREARSEVGSCPMHQPDSSDENSTDTVRQADAEICCTASEPDDRAPSSPAFALSPTLAAVQSPVPLALSGKAAWPDAWRMRLPAPDTHIPRHLLLSVLLV